MSRKPEVVLVHGYTGSPADLDPLASALASVAGPDHVAIVTLPGHGLGGAPPPFDHELFIGEIKRAVEAAAGRGGVVVLIGHSTGGTMALSFLVETGFTPALLVLAAAPKRVDVGCLDRWRRLGGPVNALSLVSLSRLAALVNHTGSGPFPSRFPVLILHGDQDELVPPSAPYAWDEGDFPDTARRVTVPGAGHDLFTGPTGPVAGDIVLRAVRDSAAGAEEERETPDALAEIECEMKEFVTRTPGSASHLARCPSALSAQGKEVRLRSTVPWDPVFANIEITTRCRNSCVYCARRRGTSPKDLVMSKTLFAYLVALLPHAYRITLVGLGEPLLHPGVTEFVAHAVEKGRRVGLVTNAMHLDKGLSLELLHAGLSAIAFSIDARDPELAGRFRPGTDMGTITENIRGFMEACPAHPNVSVAIFSALSAKNIRQFGDLVDLASELGVHVLMATDLNFKEHAADSLSRTIDSETRSLVREAVSRAFARRLPVLSVHGLEAFNLFQHYPDSCSFHPTPSTRDRAAGGTVTLRGKPFPLRSKARQRCATAGPI